MKEETKTCQNCKREFLIEPEDFEFYEKIKVPPPTWCSACRAARRFIWRNEKTLWRVKSDATGEDIFSMFPPSTFKIYEEDHWNSDKWDASDYGRDYDYKRPFFEQFHDLMYAVPWFNLSTISTVNSSYCNNALNVKNCYLCFDVGYLEDCSYCVGSSYLKNCFDMTSCVQCERSAHNFSCYNCYETFYSLYCDQSTGLWFSRDCIGCSNCFGCAGLRNKNYYIFNKPHKKEDYFELLKGIDVGSYKALSDTLRKAREFHYSIPVKYMHGKQNVSVTGEYIYNSKNVKKSFWVRGAEDCKYLQSCSFGPNREVYDCCIAGIGAERSYECQGVGVQSADVLFSVLIYSNCYRVSYSMNCHNVDNCFGCVGLQKKKYCILNKQYSKQDYYKVVDRVIEHMNSMPYRDNDGRIYKYGEFFPPELCPFAYNESIAQEYIPLNREEALAQRFKWRDKITRGLSATFMVRDLPDRIEDVGNNILDSVVGCEHRGECEDGCTVGFRFTPQELEFYRSMGMALPRLCFFCRHKERLALRNPMEVRHRRCNCVGGGSENEVFKNTAEHFHGSDPCPNEFETSYAPDRPEIVYCESCYNAEVV